MKIDEHRKMYDLEGRLSPIISVLSYDLDSKIAAYVQHCGYEWAKWHYTLKRTRA